MMNKISRILKRIESIFELLIWNFRLFILVPVIFSLLSALRLFIIGTVDIGAGLLLSLNFKNPEGEATVKIVAYIIGGIDYYLIGIVLLIFALGIYELFISEISIRDENNSILEINTLEELKSKLVNVIVVALIVSLFKRMLNLDLQQVSDVVYIALAILLISISQYLLNLNYHSPSKHNRTDEKSNTKRAKNSAGATGKVEKKI